MEKRCLICGRPYDGVSASKYCSVCGAQIKAARMSARYEQNKEYYRIKYRISQGSDEELPGKRVGAESACAVCGKPIILRGGNQKYCEECSAEITAIHNRERGQSPKTSDPVRQRKMYRKINIKICAVCGKPFADPPSSKRVCCSKECSSIRKSLTHRGISYEWSEEAKARNSGNWNIQNLANGTEAALKLPEGQRGPQNREAKRWTLKSPEGIVYEIVNLLDWCRNHAELFGKEPTDHNAHVIATGFHNVKRSMEGKLCPPVLSYKDWTLLDWGEKPGSETDPIPEKTGPRFQLTAPDGTVYLIDNFRGWLHENSDLFGENIDEHTFKTIYNTLMQSLSRQHPAKRYKSKYSGWILIDRKKEKQS